VADYGHYFLGSIVISDKDGQKFIIDGQQRLTTLTLLLIFLQHQLSDQDQKGQIADLIFSLKYGKHSFNLDVPERNPCMEALYKGEEFAHTDASESVANIVGRYADIGDLFPEELTGSALPYFADWLVENVHLVLRLNRKVHRVGPSPPPATASDEWLVGDPMNLLSVSEH
jgi:hypothetical protein